MFNESVGCDTRFMSLQWKPIYVVLGAISVSIVLWLAFFILIGHIALSNTGD